MAGPNSFKKRRTAPAALKQYQFKPGQSGNPLGRKAKAESFRCLLEKVLDERIRPERANSPTKREVLARRLVMLAVEGRAGALQCLLERIYPIPHGPTVNIANTVSTSDDVLARLMQVMRSIDYRHRLDYLRVLSPEGPPGGSDGKEAGGPGLLTDDDSQGPPGA